MGFEPRIIPAIYVKPFNKGRKNDDNDAEAIAEAAPGPNLKAVSGKTQDQLDLMHASADGRLDEMQVNWADDHAMTVVLAAKVYPGAYEKGSGTRGLSDLPETSHQMTFHAGTTRADGKVTATGGRVLTTTARAKSLAYALSDAIDWPEGQHRRDIGWRAL